MTSAVRSYGEDGFGLGYQALLMLRKRSENGSGVCVKVRSGAEAVPTNPFLCATPAGRRSDYRLIEFHSRPGPARTRWWDTDRLKPYWNGRSKGSG